MDKFIPLSVPNLNGNELEYVKRAIQDEWVSTAGSFISDFESELANYVGADQAVACQSGTAGLHLALRVNNIGEGDEVIVPALTFIAAVNPVKYVNAEPIFIDCDDSLCMDMNKVEQFLIEECIFENDELTNRATGRKVKAMIVVHVFGNIADIEKAIELKRKYNLILIEDATEALGSYITKGVFNGKYAGTIGDIGVYSFNGNKIITTGGGGMIVSNDPEKLRRMRHLSTQAKADPLYYDHDEIGYNYRMTNLQAALGLAQLEQLEGFIETKTANYYLYQELGISLMKFRSDIRPNHWFYSFITDQRDALISYLSDKNIQTRPIWNLICDLKPYHCCQKHKIEKAYYYWQHVVNIPCSSNLLREDIEVVVSSIREFK